MQQFSSNLFNFIDIHSIEVSFPANHHFQSFSHISFQLYFILFLKVLKVQSRICFDWFVGWKITINTPPYFPILFFTILFIYEMRENFILCLNFLCTIDDVFCIFKLMDFQSWFDVWTFNYKSKFQNEFYYVN